MMLETINVLIHAIPFPDWISPDALRIGQFSIKWYGIGYIAGVMFAYYWATRLRQNKAIWAAKGNTRAQTLIPDKKMLEDFVFYALLGIIIGGRLGSVLLYNPSQYFADPIKIFYIWEGGMAFHGGFTGVCIAVIYMARTRGLEIWRMADIIAPGAAIGIGFVRLANFINQELYGRITEVPWAFIFATDPGSYPRHPSQLYEAFLEGLVIFIILNLAIYRLKILSRPGICAGGFMCLYSGFRIFIENFREPDASLFGPLTRGMAYSLPMLLIGLGIMIWAARRPPVAPIWASDTTQAST